FLLDSIILFFNVTPITHIYSLSLHDALPICNVLKVSNGVPSSITAIPASRAFDAASPVPQMALTLSLILSMAQLAISRSANQTQSVFSGAFEAKSYS